jgi:hypothetical protein
MAGELKGVGGLEPAGLGERPALFAEPPGHLGQLPEDVHAGSRLAQGLLVAEINDRQRQRPLLRQAAATGPGTQEPTEELIAHHLGQRRLVVLDPPRPDIGDEPVHGPLVTHVDTAAGRGQHPELGGPHEAGIIHGLRMGLAQRLRHFPQPAGAVRAAVEQAGSGKELHQRGDGTGRVVLLDLLRQDGHVPRQPLQEQRPHMLLAPQREPPVRRATMPVLQRLLDRELVQAASLEPPPLLVVFGGETDQNLAGGLEAITVVTPNTRTSGVPIGIGIEQQPHTWTIAFSS